MQAKDALYAQAEAVYRRFMAEELRISRLGGPAELTRELAATTMGLFREATLGSTQDFVAGGYTVVGGDYVVQWLHRRPGVQAFSSVVSMSGCTNGSSSDTYQNGLFFRHNGAVKGDYYFAFDGADMKIAGGTETRVDTCDA